MKNLRLLFVVILVLCGRGLVFGQFWNWGDEIYFRLENDSAKVIPGATVYLNGVKMEYSETCGNFADRTCYRCPKFDMDARLHLSVSLPNYLPFSDSIIRGANVRLAKPTDHDFYYENMKVPYEKIPDAYLTTCGIKDSILALRPRIEAAGGKILNQFSQCSFKNHEYGPYSLLYTLPRNDSTLSLHRYLGQTFNTGPWVKRKHHSAGIANYFLIYTRPSHMPQALKLLEQMKSDSVIRYFSYLSAFNPEPADLYAFTIYVEKGDENKVQPLIEKLLAFRIFTDPFMEFYMYACFD